MGEAFVSMAQNLQSISIINKDKQQIERNICNACDGQDFIYLIPKKEFLQITKTNNTLEEWEKGMKIKKWLINICKILSLINNQRNPNQIFHLTYQIGKDLKY